MTQVSTQIFDPIFLPELLTHIFDPTFDPTFDPNFDSYFRPKILTRKIDSKIIRQKSKSNPLQKYGKNLFPGIEMSLRHGRQQKKHPNRDSI